MEKKKKSDTTTIEVTRETHAKLKAIGLKGDKYDDIIRRLLDEHEKNKRSGKSEEVD